MGSFGAAKVGCQHCENVGIKLKWLAELVRVAVMLFAMVAT